MEKSGLKWLGQDELQPPDTCKTLVEPSSHDLFHGSPAPAQGLNQSYDKRKVPHGKESCHSAAAHHVSANKEVTGVCGEEFQMERLQRCHLRCISWRPERRTKGRKIQRSKVPAISQRGNMKLHRMQAHTHTEHKQQTGSHDPSGAAVFHGLERGGARRGYFEGRLAVTDDHHRPSIKLTSQQPGGRSCAAAWLCRRAWDLREEAEVESEVGATCAKADYVGGKMTAVV